MDNSEKFYVSSGGKRGMRQKIPEDYGEEYQAEKKQAQKCLDAVKHLTAQLSRTFADSMEQAVLKKYKYCIIFRFNDDPKLGKLENETYEGIPTKTLLSDEWIKNGLKFFSKEECKPLARRIEDMLKQFNGGKDPDTDMIYRVSVFHNKKPPSVMPNGIIVGRTGIKFN